jgi:hypothetical protein
MVPLGDAAPGVLANLMHGKNPESVKGVSHSVSRS